MRKTNSSKKLFKVRFKINLLKQFSVKLLQNFRKISNIVYQKLDDWIVETVKLENLSMNELIEEIRECINNGEHFRFNPIYETIDLDVVIESNSFIKILVKIISKCIVSKYKSKRLPRLFKIRCF
jgi:hypothetical protein